MKALTIREPWAWAILWAGKDIENRKWVPDAKLLRPGGRLAIHAAMEPVDNWDEAVAQIHEASGGLFAAIDHLREVRVPRWEDMAHGAVVGTVVFDGLGLLTRGGTIVSQVSGYVVENPWASSGSAWWRLAEPQAIQPPIPCKGKQGLWNLPRKVLAEMVARDARSTRRQR